MKRLLPSSMLPGFLKTLAAVNCEDGTLTCTEVETLNYW
jgi:hypothetical protein